MMRIRSSRISLTKSFVCRSCFLRLRAARRCLNTVFAFSRRSPTTSRNFAVPKFVAKTAVALVQQQTFDVIVVDFMTAAGVIPWDWPTPKVLFTHNVEAMIWRRHYESRRESSLESGVMVRMATDGMTAERTVLAALRTRY